MKNKSIATVSRHSRGATEIEGKQNGMSVGVVNYAGGSNGIQIGLINYGRDNPKYLKVLPIINAHFD